MTRTGTGTLLVAAVLVTLLFIPLVSATGDELIAAPLNPAFVTYRTDLSSAPHATLFATTSGTSQVQDDTPRLGLIPSPVYRPDILDTPLFDTQIPESDQLTSDQSSYDLRNDGKVSPVRDQGHFGTCWAFATYGSLESTLMPANPTPDFSEKNLVNRSGFPISSDPDIGGDIGMSAAYLARWNGPVNESTDPYPTGVWTTSDTYLPVYHIQNIVYFPGRTNRTDTANIKEALTRWGAVFSSFYWANTFYNSANTAYYQPPSSGDDQPGGGGHGVTIVGWDDTFAASNFNTPPPGNGAWLAKNSWGTGWGRSGYFYISYYDKYFGSAVSPSGSIWTTAVVLGESTANYDTVYDYDRQGEVKDYSYATTRTGGFANVFTANTTETVAAIGFYTTDVNVTCNISIYTNPTSGPIGGALAALYNTTLPYMGYNTVTLPPDQRVPVTAGTNFSVVLQVTNPTNARYIPVEENLEGYSGGITSEYGQGYLLGSTGWIDLKTIRDNSHVCVKAYTRSTTTPPIANFTANGTVINQSATVFIGEEGLNLTYALNQAQEKPVMKGEPALKTIGWWAPGSPVDITSPTRILDLNGRYTWFTVEPSDFVGYTGTWYVLRENQTAVREVFTVADPALNMKILDFTHIMDVTGKSVPQNTRLGFGIVTNMYPAVDDRYRSPINAATDGYITITVKNATGSPMQSLYNNSASAGTLAGPHSLRANFVDTQPWTWGGNDTWAWQTSARDRSDQYAYPPGTYTVTAESTLNHMKDNYRFYGADFTGKTVSPPYTITLRVCGDFNRNNIVDIGDTARVAYMVVGLTPMDMAADFNTKGTVDAGDAAKIAWFLVGKVPAL